jgi:hypothetical protein
MKDHVDKSMGIVILISESLVKIKPTDPSRFSKCDTHKKRNCSDSSVNSPAKILPSRCTWKKNRRTKSSETRPEVLTTTVRKTMGSGLSSYSWRSFRLFILTALFRAPSDWGAPVEDPVCESVPFARYLNCTSPWLSVSFPMSHS